MMNDIFFDLETQKSFQEVGGRENLRLLRLSVAVTLSSATNEFKSYGEKQVDALVADLKAADRVIGFNLLGFDYPVLKPYTSERLNDLHTVDMLAEIYDILGFRVSLDTLVNATLGTKKTGDGLDAIRWYREGRIDELTAYCREDVALTRKLYEAGRDHGFVYFTDKFGARKKVNVNWS